MRKFRHNSVDEAIREIKREMGREALIIDTRRVRRKGLLGWFRAPQVELTAALEDAPVSPLLSLPRGEAVQEPAEAAEDNTGSGQVTGASRPDDGGLVPELRPVPGPAAGRGPVPGRCEPARTLGQPAPVVIGGGSEGPHVVALVGPTGAGKTTTCAKLAASFALGTGISVGMMTLDTFRIGAVEQIKTYARIMGLPLEVVFNPGEIRGAMKRLSHCDLIIVDTAGRSYRERGSMEELAGYFDGNWVDEVHLVLSLTTRLEDALRAIEAYRSTGYTRLLLTKVDEASNSAGAVYLRSAARVPLSYMCTGQNVPDDIELARPEVLARHFAEGAVC